MLGTSTGKLVWTVGKHVVLAWVILSGVVLRSAEAATQQSRERTARKACLSGNADKGVAILSDLFLDTEDATYIYNQGRCYELNHRYEDAVSRFREFLLKAPKLSDAEKVETQKHIADCQSYLGKSESPRSEEAVPSKPLVVESRPVPAPLPASPTANPVVPVTAQPNVEIRQIQPSDAPRGGAGLRTAGAVAAMVGAVAIGAGVVLNLKVNSMSDELQKKWDPSDESSRKDYKTLGWVSYGAGAACLVGGAVLYYVGWQKGRPAGPSISLLPVVDSGQVGATLGGVF